MLIFAICFLVTSGIARGEDFPSLISANASLAVVLDREFLGDRYQKMLDEVKDHIKELARVELKHGGVIVHYYSWTTINLKRGLTAVFSVASCTDTWSLFSRTEEHQLLLFALTEADCPRLPADNAITVTFMDPGQELPQMLLDLRTRKAFNWKSAIILHDDTLNRYMVSRVVQSLTLQVDDKDVSSVSVSVFKMKHEINDYLRRKEMHRVLSKLPVKFIGENFIAIVTSDVMSTMAETARELKMSHTQAQWLYVVSDTDINNGNLSAHINALYEGENIAYIYNTTNIGPECENSVLCYCKEMLNAFVSALDSAVQDEFDVAAQVSDEEWEAIRPTKMQRRDMLLRHMQQHIAVHSHCGNCSIWRAIAADTWGATYTGYTELEVEPNPDLIAPVETKAKLEVRDNKEVNGKHNNNQTDDDGAIEHIHLLQVGYWRPVDGIMFTDALFPHVQHGFRGKELPIVTFHNPPWTILQVNESGFIVSYTGLVFDIIDQLAKAKNFTVKLISTNVAKQDYSNESSTDQLHNPSALAAMALVAKGHVFLAAASFTVLADPIPAGITSPRVVKLAVSDGNSTATATCASVHKK